MGLNLLPQKIRYRYQVDERRHACAILADDHPNEFEDLVGCLSQFHLFRSEIVNPGGRKAKIATRFDDYLFARGWSEKSTTVEMSVDGIPHIVKTHSIDLCKGHVACEVQWNSKDGDLSHELTTFRQLHELNIISVGVIITRSDELQDIFSDLGWVKDKKDHWQRIASKYGQSTTHWIKVINRILGGDSGICPVLLIGIKKDCYSDDMPDQPVVFTKPAE